MCLQAGYTLVDFNTGLSNNQIVYDLLKKWLIRNCNIILYYTHSRGYIKILYVI